MQVDNEYLSRTSKGFLGALFDFSFSTFIATRIVKLLYVVAMLIAGIQSLIILFWCMNAFGFAGMLLGLVLVPIFFLLNVAIARILLEVMIVLFRIAENTTVMAESTTGMPRQRYTATSEPEAY